MNVAARENKVNITNVTKINFPKKCFPEGHPVTTELKILKL